MQRSNVGWLKQSEATKFNTRSVLHTWVKYQMNNYIAATHLRMVCSDSWDCMEHVRASVFVDVNIHSTSVACVANFIKMRCFSLPADCRTRYLGY